MDSIKEIVEVLAFVIDLVGVLILVYCCAKLILTYFRLEVDSFQQGGFLPKSKLLRSQLGVYLLLGLEFMVVADIIKTILDPNVSQLIQLGLIVAIRTVIGFFLGRELKEMN